MQADQHVVIMGLGMVGRAMMAALTSRSGPYAHVTGVDPDMRTHARMRSLVLQHASSLSPPVDLVASLDRRVAPAGLYFIAVATPARPDGQCDVSAVARVFDAACAHAAPGATIAIRSTVPPGTCDQLEACARAAERSDLSVCSNPEFLRARHAAADCMRPWRVVIGAKWHAQADALRTYYQDLLGVDTARILVMGRRSAEAAKYVANAMLAARVAHFDELLEWAVASGGGRHDVTDAVGRDPRIGSIYSAGGYGGDCLPKDVRHLLASAGDRLVALHAVDRSNRRRRGEHA